MIQFKVFLRLEDGEIDLVDGGTVDWTQRLLSNKNTGCLSAVLGWSWCISWEEDANIQKIQTTMDKINIGKNSPCFPTTGTLNCRRAERTARQTRQIQGVRLA